MNRLILATIILCATPLAHAADRTYFLHGEDADGWYVSRAPHGAILNLSRSYWGMLPVVLGSEDGVTKYVFQPVAK